MEFKCPVCYKIKSTPMDLAKHIIEAIGEEHRNWLNSLNLDLSKGFKPLADFLEENAEKIEN